MSRKRAILAGVAGCALLLGFLLLLETTLRRLLPVEDPIAGVYHSLPPDTSKEDPLLYLDEDFTVLEGFHSNLPIVILTLDGPLPEYKFFVLGKEQIDESIDPWIGGSMQIIGADSTEDQINRLTDAPSYESAIRIKKRGNASFRFIKPQYYIKSILPDGSENHSEILGMGEGDKWVLNGSIADKSLMRNYLSFRISSEASGSAMAPDSRYCEVLLRQEDGSLLYQGVYLLIEAVSRGANRVSIDKFQKKNIYTSYIVRRDRFKHMDPMLETYGRLNGFSDTWIGLKYPSENSVTPEALAFVEEDFSRIEKVIYSDRKNTFLTYHRYIDVESFVDYFLLNEYFNNYDAGKHSTYMYKSTGGRLMIGPVWDFDQAMDNYNEEETGVEYLAFQTKTFYQELVQDKAFVRKLKKRYQEMRESTLSDEHVMMVIDETAAYLRSSQKRDWIRWEEYYYIDDPYDPRVYALKDYVQDTVVLDRLSTDYDQELRIIRTYLLNHARYIQPELSHLLDGAELDSSFGSYGSILFIGFLLLMLAIGLISKRRD